MKKKKKCLALKLWELKIPLILLTNFRKNFTKKKFEKILDTLETERALVLCSNTTERISTTGRSPENIDPVSLFLYEEEIMVQIMEIIVQSLYHKSKNLKCSERN